MRGENLNKEAVVETLRCKWDTMQNHLDERGRRVWAASEAKALGRGGVTMVHSDRRSAATGMSRSAITQGIAEMAHPQDAAPPDRARMAGGGRKKNR
jgi:chemotaxis response regulator CheB